MRKRKTEKNTVLPVRPQPPSFAQIQEDVKRAAKNDYIFVSIKPEVVDEKDNSKDTQEDEEKSSDLEEHVDKKSIEERYKQVCRFLEINKSLQDGRVELSDLCATLAETSAHVKSAMTELQEKLEKQQELLQPASSS